jgi:hypothetical protein
MAIYRGVVQDNVVILPEDVQLPDGLVVEVNVPRQAVEEVAEMEQEERFKQGLVERGLLGAIRRPAPTPRAERTLIKIRGAPLSEEIIRDRR